jgi:hypothetical protein
VNSAARVYEGARFVAASMIGAGDPWMTLLEVRDGKVVNQRAAYMSRYYAVSSSPPGRPSLSPGSRSLPLAELGDYQSRRPLTGLTWFLGCKSVRGLPSERRALKILASAAGAPSGGLTTGSFCPATPYVITVGKTSMTICLHPPR